MTVYTYLSSFSLGAQGLAWGWHAGLSMARHFLEGLMGFMVLDDPMVDMDVARQQAAAMVVQEFARDRQIIILTCHEAHAKLLAGNIIELG